MVEVNGHMKCHNTKRNPMANKKRKNWKHGLEFLMSCIGSSVGLGNIWRFPYICYKNGGAAFLIPYFLCLLVVGFPQTLQQFIYPQYSNLGPGKAWICCPLFKGIGYGMLGITAVVSIYYNIIIAWALYYLANAFRPDIPWASCNHNWNSEICATRTADTNNSIIFYNVTKEGNTTFKTPTEEFWENHVLDISSGIESLGKIKWQLLLCNLAVWIITCLCVYKGIRMTGKIMYVAASLPHIFLSILLIRGLTLPGSLDGMKFYFIPRWRELLSITVWTDAAIQAIYSLGFGSGSLVVLASYNKFNHNLYRDAVIIPLIDAFTSLFAGCVIFATLGYMSYQLKVDIGKVVAEGPGIAFVVYPEALTSLPFPYIWSVLFFATLFILGLNSQMVHIQNIATAFSDISPRVFQHRLSWTTGGICLAGFLLGLPCVTQGGVYVIQLIDWYLASCAILLISFLETFVLAWFYGSDRLLKDLEMMIGKRISSVWIIFWKFLSPLCLFLVVVFNISHHKPVKYGEQDYPLWSIGVGWFIGLIPFIPMPISMAITLTGLNGTLLQRLRKSLQPSPEWKPAGETTNKNELQLLC